MIDNKHAQSAATANGLTGALYSRVTPPAADAVRSANRVAPRPASRVPAALPASRPDASARESAARGVLEPRATAAVPVSVRTLSRPTGASSWFVAVGFDVPTRGSDADDDAPRTIWASAAGLADRPDRPAPAPAVLFDVPRGFSQNRPDPLVITRSTIVVTAVAPSAARKWRGASSGNVRFGDTVASRVPASRMTSRAIGSPSFTSCRAVTTRS